MANNYDLNQIGYLAFHLIVKNRISI